MFWLHHAANWRTEFLFADLTYSVCTTPSFLRKYVGDSVHTIKLAGQYVNEQLLRALCSNCDCVMYIRGCKMMTTVQKL